MPLSKQLLRILISEFHRVLVQVRYRDIEARRHLLQTVDLLVRAKRLELELQK